VHHLLRQELKGKEEEEDHQCVAPLAANSLHSGLFRNTIPEELKLINKLNSFKNHPKSHLFNDIKY